MPQRSKISIAMLLPVLLTMMPVAHGFEAERYLNVADNAIKSARRSKLKDVDRLIEQERELVRLGVEACLEYAEQNPTDLKLMQLVVLNSQRIQNLPREEIEKGWIEGAYLDAHGVAVDKIDPQSPALRMLDLIVRPAGAVATLREVQKSRNASLIERALGDMEKARDSAVAQR